MRRATNPGRRTTKPLWAAVTAAFISVAGTAMTAIAIPLLVLSGTGSGTAAGLVAFAELAPYLLAQFFGGPVVDRQGLRRVTVAGNAAAGVLVCLVPWLYLGVLPQLWVICALVALAGTARGFADLGSGALVPVLAAAAAVPMTRAAALNNTAQRSGLVLGGLAGGLLLTVASPSVVILVDGLSFLVAAALFASLRGIEAPVEPGNSDPAAAPESYRIRLQAGIAFIGREPLVRALVLISASTNLWAAALSGVLLQAWSLDRGVTAGALGTIFAALALGQVAGGIISAAWGPRIPRFPTVVAGFLVGGPPMFLAPALTGSPLAVGIIVLLSGVALGFVNPVLGAVYYERIPVPLLARVLGTIRATVWIGVAVGPLLGGVLVSALGVRSTLLVCCVGYAALALAPLVVPVFRDLSRIVVLPSPDTAPSDAPHSDGPDSDAPGSDLGATPVVTATLGSPESEQLNATVRLPSPRSAEHRPEPSTRSDGPVLPMP